MAEFKENLDTLFEKLKDFIKTETVVGQAIHVDDTIIVPFVTVTFGAGTGGTLDDGKSGGNGGGAGARITPDAVLVIKGDKITLLPINGTNSMNKLLDMVPNILSKFGKKKEDASEIEIKRPLK